MRCIQVDALKEKGPFDSFFRTCVGAGRAAEVARKASLDQLREVHEQCGFTYLRFHGLLHDEMAVYQEDTSGAPVYNWQYVDMVYDEILACGMKPFVELSYMPEKLASGTQHLFWWNANVTPPKDYTRWGELIRALTAHWTARYGREEVRTWLFEVWNEPNHPSFFSGTQEEYFRLYEVTAKAVKSVCGEYKVGGPASAGSAWVPELIEYCYCNQIPLDFVSTHTYSVQSGHFDEFGDQELFIHQDTDLVSKDVRMVAEQVRQSPMPCLPVHYTEWSSSYSARDASHDSYIQASFILYQLKRIQGNAASMSYWTFSDIFEETGVPLAPFHGGFGLMNLQGLRKPSFYAYQYLNRLGPEEIQNPDPDSFACKSENGVQVLLWEYHRPKQDVCNREYFTRDLRPKALEPVSLKITGLAPGRYRMRLYQVGYGVNDVYHDFTEAHFTDLPTQEETAKLKKQTSGEAVRSESIQIGPNGTYERLLPMREYDCFLLELSSETT